MARAAMRWTLDDVARRAGVGRATVSRFEVEQVEPNLSTETMIRQTFERAGVEFIDGDAPGVRLHSPPRAA